MSSHIFFCEAYSDWQDINYALVTLDRDHIKWILDRMALAKKLKRENGNFYGLEYFDNGTTAWYRDIAEVGELAEWQEVFEKPANNERTDLNTVVITDDTCQWMSHPKHADDITVHTAILTIENLRNLL